MFECLTIDIISQRGMKSVLCLLFITDCPCYMNTTCLAFVYYSHIFSSTEAFVVTVLCASMAKAR